MTLIPSTRKRLGALLIQAWINYQLQIEALISDAGYENLLPANASALYLINRIPAMSISDLARKLDITRQGASKVVFKLVKLGYLEVQPSIKSSREKSLFASERGVGYLIARKLAAEQVEVKFNQNLGDAQYKLFLNALMHFQLDESWNLRKYLGRYGLALEI